ncbi:MAG: HAMP domain-containing histidine kinase [Bacteroidetes bacterium]|nr:HAMP domain-containing histidine kinase [Bacteroidota bacterium]
MIALSNALGTIRIEFKNMGTLCTSIILSVCFGIPCFAQSNTAYGIQKINTETGLPSNAIRGMQWDDKTGFIWIVTEVGIVRYDGIECKNYSFGRKPVGTPLRGVLSVKREGGQILLSDGSGNIYTVKDNQPVLYNAEITDPSLINYSLCSVSDTLWKSKAASPPVFPSPFDNIIRLSDTSCLIEYFNGLYRFSLSDKKPELVSNTCKFIFKIGDNTFILDSNNRPGLLNTSTLTTVPLQLESKDDDFIQKNDNNFRLFWNPGLPMPVIVKKNKAWFLNFSNNKIIAHLITDTIPPGADISCLYYNNTNRLLIIGTEYNGVLVLSPLYTTPMKKSGVKVNTKLSCFSQIDLNDGNILTNEGDIIGTNPEHVTRLPVNGKFADRISFTDNNRFLWYTTYDEKTGIYCFKKYDYSTGETTSFNKINHVTRVLKIGEKIFLSNIKGVGLLQGDSMVYQYVYPDNEKGTRVIDFTELKSGKLAILGCRGLLLYDTLTHKIDTLYKKGSTCIDNIWKYEDYFFIGSYGAGYLIYKNGKIMEMPVDKNGFLLYCHCFVKDQFGFCWISTDKGLFKAKLSDILAHFDNPSLPVYYHHFGKQDGVEMVELNGGCTPCAVTMKNGVISFPSVDGLLWVDPADANPLEPTGPLFADDIIIDDKAVNPDLFYSTPLSPDVTDITFKFGLSAWCHKNNIYLYYQLNDTSTWIPFNSNNYNELRLTHLHPGHFTLRIRKLNGFGAGNYSIKEITFSIRTPWYQQWWFYGINLLLLAGVIWFIIHLRTRQYKLRQKKLENIVAEKTKALIQQNEILEKNNTIKSRLISIISHDVITPLKFVTVVGNKLVDKRKLMSDEMQDEAIREMANTSQELQLLATNILNWIKYQNENRRLAKEYFNVHETVHNVTGILQSLAKQKGITLANTIDKEWMAYQFMEPLKILVYNLLTNAINFSEQSTITVSAERTADTLTVTVTDEGMGMTPEQIRNIMADQFIISSANVDKKKGNGLGYLIIKDLVKTMDATLHIESEKGKGTAVSVRMRWMIADT